MENIEKSKKFRNIFIVYLIILTAFVAVRICSGFGLFAALGSTIVVDVVSTVIIQIGIMFLLPLFLYKAFAKRKVKDVFKDFGFKKIGIKSWLICLAIGVLTFVINIFVANFFSILLQNAGYAGYAGSSAGSDQPYTIVNFLVEIVTVAILPAICEEFVHRGMLLKGVANTVGYKKAIIISSVLFGLMHLNIQQFFYATILGIFMGFLVTITRSIVPAIIVHFCNNFINVYFSFAQANNLPGSGIMDALNTLANQNILLFLVVSVAVVLLAVLGIIWLVKRLFVQNSINSYGKVFEDIETGLRKDTQMTDSEVLGAFEQVVLPNMKSPKNMIDFFIADEKKYGNVGIKFKIPMIACMFLGILITVFTFIWGCV